MFHQTLETASELSISGYFSVMLEWLLFLQTAVEDWLPSHVCIGMPTCHQDS